MRRRIQFRVLVVSALVALTLVPSARVNAFSPLPTGYEREYLATMDYSVGLPAFATGRDGSLFDNLAISADGHTQYVSVTHPDGVRERPHLLRDLLDGADEVVARVRVEVAARAQRSATRRVQPRVEVALVVEQPAVGRVRAHDALEVDVRFHA